MIRKYVSKNRFKTSLRMERVWNYIYVYRTFQKMQQLETYFFNKNNI